MRKQEEQYWDPEIHPACRVESAAFATMTLAHPEPSTPASRTEFLYYPARQSMLSDLFVSEWNTHWECGQLLGDFRTQNLEGFEFPKSLQGLIDATTDDTEIRLLPRFANSEYTAYAAYEPLYALLGRESLEQFGLFDPEAPLCALWPAFVARGWCGGKRFKNFERKLKRAWAHYVWPMLFKQSPISRFSRRDPIKLLAHDLDFWLGHLDRVIRDRALQFKRAVFDETVSENDLEMWRSQGRDGYLLQRPRQGGRVWEGEAEASQVSREVVTRALQNGQLQKILEAIRSTRVEEDFSQSWSRTREDFERKLYSKRSKWRPKFVELTNAAPFHSPESEIIANDLWGTLTFVTVNPKERQIIACLRSGVTKTSEIAQELGYANHSPVSKRLAKIASRAKKLFD